jgi:hypothetical protein
MAAHVGGRMETKAPLRVTDRSDHLRLAALVVASLALHAWMIGNSAMTARDSIGFARLAVNLTHPSDGIPDPEENRLALLGGLYAAVPDGVPRTLPEVLKSAQQPPGYPLTIYATYAVVKRLDPPPGGAIVHDQILRSAQYACAAAMILAVLPMYWLGRMLLDKNRSFSAVLLFQFLPVVARDTSDGLSEGLFFLGLSSTLALGVAGLRKQSVGRFLFCGLAAGMTYLVRPEGLAVAVAVLGVLAWLALAKLRPRRNMLACATALLAGTGIAAAPYMLLIGGITNKPSGKQATEEFSNPRFQSVGMRENGGPLFAEWRRDGDDATAATKALDAAGAILREYLHASHWAVGILGAVGFALTIRRFRDRPEWMLLAGAAAIHLAVLARVAYVQGYASERHLLSPAFAATYFAMAGIPILFERLSLAPVVGGFYRRPEALWVWVAILIAICIPSLLKPMHENRIGFRLGGLYLAERLARDERPISEGGTGAKPQVTDPSEWVQYYAGRTYHRPPALTTYRKEGVEYAVHLPNRDRNDSRLNAIAYTTEMANDPKAQLVFSWPEGPEEKVKVKIYRRVNPPWPVLRTP